MLAISVEIPFHEYRQAHELVMVIRGPDGSPVVEGRFGMAPMTFAEGALFPGESLHVPSVQDLRFVGVASYGLHDMELTLNDESAGRLAFFVVEGTAP